MAVEPKRFLGKFRGRVIDNKDPLSIGRLRVQVPDVLGDTPSTWAMPCFPAAGRGMGHYAIPTPDAGVWVEFEQGDPSYPVWSGCWYGSADELPADVRDGAGEHNAVLRTPGGRQVLLSDEPGGKGITLSVPGGACLVIDDNGIRIADGQGAVIELAGSVVDINQGRLRVDRK